MKKAFLATIRAIKTLIKGVSGACLWSSYGLLYGAINGTIFMVEIGPKNPWLASIWTFPVLIIGVMGGAIFGAILGAFGGVFFMDSPSARPNPISVGKKFFKKFGAVQLSQVKGKQTVNDQAPSIRLMDNSNKPTERNSANQVETSVF